MPQLKDLTERIVKFRNERDWKQFHTPKDMMLSLMIEAAELAELFQWRSDEQIRTALDQPGEYKDQLGRELSDVLYWVLLLANDLGVDLDEAFSRKMEENESKYPVALAKGSSAKYSQLKREEV